MAAPCAAVCAMEVEVQGEATVENEDITLARQIALRRAMVAAVERSGGWLQAKSVATPAGIQERSSLSARNRVLGARILDEQLENDKLKLTAAVRLAGSGELASCDERPLRKVLVAPFPLHLPEQLASGEYTSWPEATADHLTRVLNRGRRLLAAPAVAQHPFVSPEAAPEPWRKDGVPVLLDWARGARAQYVLAGVFRDFGTTRKLWIVPERQLVVEAFLYDGTSGELLMRRDFTRELWGNVRLPQTMVFGSKAFTETTLGGAYLDLMREIARWAEQSVACLPFSARVIQSSGTRLHLDVGSDSGLEPGMEFLLTRTGEEARTPEGELLGTDRKPLAGVVVKSVHPRHSVAEITAKKKPPAGRVGDVLFGQ